MGAWLDRNEKIRTRFESVFPTLEPDLPVEKPNSPTPVNSSGDWARLSLLSDGSPEFEAAGPGSPERYFETVQLEIFVEIESGIHRALEIADNFASVWRSASDGTPAIAGYTFYPMEVIEVGRVGDSSSHWKVDCLVSFYRSYQP